MQNVRHVGNTIVATGLTLDAVLILSGAAGIAFLLEGGLLFAFVAGVLMIRGLFGDNGAVGGVLWVGALAIGIMMLFMQGAALLAAIVFGIVLLGLAVSKRLDLW